MKIVLAPKTALAPTPPAVGIFWCVNGVLVIDCSTLGEAEPYGDCGTLANLYFGGCSPRPLGHALNC